MPRKHHGNLLVLVGLYVGNFFYSVAKRPLNTSFPLMKDLHVTTEHMGKMSTEFSFAYGVSKLLGGVLSDLFPSYTLYTLGLYLGAALNLLIAGATDIDTISVLWMLNGLGQGPGGPALSRLVIEHFPPRSRASVWSSLTFACNMGYLLSPALLNYFIYFGWQGPFVFTGLASLLSAALMSALYMLYLYPTYSTSDTEEKKSASSSKSGKDSSGSGSGSGSDGCNSTENNTSNNTIPNMNTTTNQNSTSHKSNSSDCVSLDSTYSDSTTTTDITNSTSASNSTRRTPR